MHVKDVINDEIERRNVQLKSLEIGIVTKCEEGKDVTNARTYHQKAAMSLAGVKEMLDQGLYEKAVYLFAQGCWNLGYVQAALNRL